VDDEVLAGLAALIGVVHARVHERLLDALPVDQLHRLIGVLLDDREQIAEQPPLGDRQLRALDRLAPGRVFDPVDRRTGGGRDPGGAAPARARCAFAVAGGATSRATVAAIAGRSATGVATAGRGGTVAATFGRGTTGCRAGGALCATGGYTLARGFALLRNLRPSSYRCA
jgi:hypothetical protein